MKKEKERKYEIVFLEKDIKGDFMSEMYDKVSTIMFCHSGTGHTEFRWLVFKNVNGVMEGHIINDDKIFRIKMYDKSVVKLHDVSCDVITDVLSWKSQNGCKGRISDIV